ncbi:SUN domain-containing protein 5 isoform X2 [Musa acuminata AAA Group]|uniref:SUN domain-containing protein 5 isoform X2 n=1 Tax=Musa acuminata AAA Group TaxID=214697 RepID=UPI0031D82D3C
MKKKIDVATHGGRRRKSLYELSLTVALPLWCLLFVLHSRLGHGDRRRDLSSDGDGSGNLCRSTQLESYFPFMQNNTFSCCGLKEPENPMRELIGVEEAIANGKASEEEKGRNCSRAKEKADPPTQSGYIGLDEFRNQTLRRKENDADKLHGKITHRLEPGGLEYNYASSAKGAKVLAHNKEAKGAGNILCRDKDKYLRNPCSAVDKFVVIELSEETLVDAIEIANLEHYSSNFKGFELLGSLSYPTETWTPLGVFSAENVKHAQRFMLPEPKWTRYMRLSLVSHYGSEFYCTLSYVEVYGVDAIERMLEDLIVVPVEPATNQMSVEADPKSGDKVEAAQVHGGDDVHSKADPNKSSTLHPVKEGRQQLTGRVPSDGILKILMQKMRSMELSQSILEEYIKELNRRYGEALPDLQKQCSESALVLQKMSSEIKEMMEWKECKEKELTDLENWKASVSAELDALVKDNALFRANIEKIQSSQDLLESKELTVISISLFLACFAFFKLVFAQLLTLFKTCESDMRSRNKREWLLIFVSSSLTILITLLYG